MKGGIFTAVLCACAVLLASCADENGLHNLDTRAKVTFVFENMGESVNGNYAIPGNFDNSGDWEKLGGVEPVDVKLVKGAGTSNPITISAANIQFTLVKTGDDSWSRDWFPAIQGNSPDGGNGMRNFYIDGVPEGEVTVRITGDATESTVAAE